MRTSEAMKIARGEHHGFSWRRVGMAVLVDPTRQLETALGVLFLIVRGVFLIRFGYYYPGVESLLRHLWLNEIRLGWTCIALGLIHVYVAGTDNYRLRAVVCGVGVFLAVAVFGAFMAGEPTWQPTATTWLSIMLCESYLFYRNILTRDVAKVLVHNHEMANEVSAEREA